MGKSYDFSETKRGAVVPAPAGTARIMIRIDDDVLNWFRNQLQEAEGRQLPGPDEPCSEGADQRSAAASGASEAARSSRG